MERVEGKREGRKLVTYTFNSPLELKELASKSPKDGVSREVREDAFCPYTWDESVKALDNGWDGADGVVEKVEALASGMVDSIGLDYSWDVVGQMVDVGTFVTGNPECWLEAEPVERPKETITIRVNCGTPWMTSASSIENRGAVITALIDALYSKYFIDLTFITPSKHVVDNTDCDAVYHLNTKNGYSRNVVAFYAAHPALLRRFYFAVCEVEFKRPNCSGYGRSIEIDKKGADIVFPILESDEADKYETIKGAQKELKKILKKVLKADIA